MELLDSLGRRYGRRPSELVGVGAESPFQAFSIDLWAHNAGVQREQLEAQKLKWQQGRKRG